MKNQQHKNFLFNETSPYLLQHAHNPVQWYPWSKEALEKAKAETKPILLSIGYSACHWCHVMAHESFENEETAAIMNEHFINIKVDREERPDIDKIYQTAQQLLTQRTGGWPLTMFLTPDDQIPFFGGTYFPPTSRYGLPGFKDLLQRVAEYYKQEHGAIQNQNRSMQEALHRISLTPPADNTLQLTPEPLHVAIEQLRQSFDPRHGGFGAAPKFPHPMNLERLLRHYINPGDDEGRQSSLDMVEITLKKMAMGGVYDQIGGGFYRYSVDERWMIPHFEKMLYDNGPLLTVYSQAAQITGNPFYKSISIETADWVMRDMQSAEGGFYSTIDADSEGQEGKFYVWDKKEIGSLLDVQEYAVIEKHYGLDNAPNFEGHWHLHVIEHMDDVAKVLSLKKSEVATKLYSARQKLLSVRNKRTWPGRDEKILTSWNGLMIKGMAMAAVAFNDERYFESAARAVEFVHKTLWKNNRLLATYKDSKAHLNAYLDDYAFMIAGILTMLNFRWKNEWLDFAIELADAMLAAFEDRENGGFYFTSHDHEQLIQRAKPFMDDALPAGNGIAAAALLQLGHLIGEQRYLESAERTLRTAWPALDQYPAAHNALLNALDEYLYPPQQIILRGDEDTLDEWRLHCQKNAHPYTSIYPIPGNVNALPGLLAERTMKSGPVAYICEGHHCLAPITRLDLIAENLNNSYN
ncbi:MAG: thioredoxin [Gammaproteobacteria bacterium RIFCSPLOWO2_01_FULL_47_190]|nr:MAG: thioredoxin [Gammaproteobacteria bacterium RIFCSPLOWO2_01_FULL_47_190]